jgi:hypothetical protein
MAEKDVNSLTPRKVVGMDMCAPYGVYVDGMEVARHSSEKEAAELYNQLTGRTKSKVVVSDASARSANMERGTHAN